MHVEENTQLSKEKGPRLYSSSRSRTLSTNLVRRAFDIEDLELGQGAIGLDQVEEHEFMSSSKSR